MSELKRFYTFKGYTLKDWIVLVVVIIVNLLGELYNMFDVYQPPPRDIQEVDEEE